VTFSTVRTIDNSLSGVFSGLNRMSGKNRFLLAETQLCDRAFSGARPQVC